MIGQNYIKLQILKKIGAGGMGEVYLAEDHELDRKVALKFLPLQYTTGADIKARFRHEAKAAAAPNVRHFVMAEPEGINLILLTSKPIQA